MANLGSLRATLKLTFHGDLSWSLPGGSFKVKSDSTARFLLLIFNSNMCTKSYFVLRYVFAILISLNFVDVAQLGFVPLRVYLIFKIISVC